MKSFPTPQANNESGRHGAHQPDATRRGVHRIVPIIVSVWLIVLLAGCGPGLAGTTPTAPPLQASPTPAATSATAVPTSASPIPSPSEAACAQVTHLANGLTEYAFRLKAAPGSGPLTFEPVNCTMDEALAVHAAERSPSTSQEPTTVNGEPALTADLNGQPLVAVFKPGTSQSPEQSIDVQLGGKTILTLDAGLPSPALPLQSLVTYDGHWALEFLYATPDVWAGQIYLDGASLNQANGYDEAFGLQLINGEPFYFFSKGGQIGANYQGETADLGYTAITHYECCSDSVLNPAPAKTLVAFFAQQGGDWYYVQIGSFQ